MTMGNVTQSKFPLLIPSFPSCTVFLNQTIDIMDEGNSGLNNANRIDVEVVDITGAAAIFAHLVLVFKLSKFDKDWWQPSISHLEQSLLQA